MAKYHYIARDNDGRRIEGIIEASSDIAVISRLRTQNLFPVEVLEVTKKYIQSKKEKNFFIKKVNLKELAIFTRQMSVMLSSGVPIIETLDDLSSQTSNKYFSSVLQSIRKSISQGSSFSQALSQFPGIFSPLYVALVRSGEESGNLAETLGEIAKNLEDQLEMRSKTKQALSYPAFVFFFFIVVLSFVFLFLIPRFQKIFESFGAKLPTFTLIILKISNILVRFLPFVLLFILFLSIIFFLFKKTEKGRYII
ncbi:type II secretion system F family protein, partial [bacterium]|nr:type II secretion system F family protein [bacterium]